MKPAYLGEAGLPRSSLGAKLILGGWSEKYGRMAATAYAKRNSATPAIVQALDGGIAPPGKPLAGLPDSFEHQDVLAAGKLQAAWLNREVGRRVAGGRLLIATLSENRAAVQDLGAL